MKTKLPQILCAIAMVSLWSSIEVNAQVGINTTTPKAGAMLDIESNDKGMLVPRLNIADLNTIAPITGGATESLLVYNTNTTTGKGFFYWSGTKWIAANGDDWKVKGNAGTDPTTHFIGTTDNTSLKFRTNDTERMRITSDGRILATQSGSTTSPLFGWSGDSDKGFYSPGADQFGLVTNGTERLRIPNANQIYAMDNGSNSAPFYSWESDTNTGMWHSGEDRVNITAGGREMVEFNENASASEVVFNNDGARTDFRVVTFHDTEALFVDGFLDNVGLGTNSPNASAQLEMADSDKGILINRVALITTNVAGPISSPTQGLLVYNTTNSGSGSTEVMPGFYYWDSSRWVAMGGTNGRDWSLEGNAGTNATANFIGTTDNNSLSIRTNDTERVYIDAGGNIGVGSLPYTNAAVRVNNAAQAYGVIAETNSTGGALYGIESGDGYATIGENYGNGLGVFGYAANSHGTFGTTSYTGGVYLTAGSVGFGSGANGANGSLAVSSQVSSSNSNMGIRAVSGSTTSISSSQILNVGVNSNATDLALYALTEKPIDTYGDLEAARFKANYTGDNLTADTRDPYATLAGYTTNSIVGSNPMYYGGYFYSGGNSPAYAYTGANYNGTRYKIIGNGTVSTIIDGATKTDTKKVMFAPEAPEVLFEDYGTARLTNGNAIIAIDPIFSNNITVDKNHPLKVFIQLEGDCNGVYVTKKTAQGFEVKELQNGSSNVSFSWHIVANRKDDSGSGKGNTSIYAGIRFPDAPPSMAPVDNVARDIKHENTKIDTIHSMN